MSTNLTDVIIKFLQSGGTADDVRAALVAALGTVAGEPVVIENRYVRLPIPRDGWLLDVRWAVSDHSYVEWYPTKERAAAALGCLAVAHDRIVVGGHLDLTQPGCLESYARLVDCARCSRE